MFGGEIFSSIWPHNQVFVDTGCRTAYSVCEFHPWYSLFAVNDAASCLLAARCEVSINFVSCISLGTKVTSTFQCCRTQFFLLIMFSCRIVNYPSCCIALVQRVTFTCKLWPLQMHWELLFFLFDSIGLTRYIIRLHMPTTIPVHDQAFENDIRVQYDAYDFAHKLGCRPDAKLFSSRYSFARRLWGIVSADYAENELICCTPATDRVCANRENLNS
jgi:hypothetical protein